MYDLCVCVCERLCVSFGVCVCGGEGYVLELSTADSAEGMVWCDIATIGVCVLERERERERGKEGWEQSGGLSVDGRSSMKTP